MSFNLDDVNVGGQLKVGSGVVPAVGEGDKRINGSVYAEGPVQLGDQGGFGSNQATLMVSRTTNTDNDCAETSRSVYVNGNQFINGDSGTRNALYVTGGSGPNSVYIEGDLYVTGQIDGDSGMANGLLVSGGSSVNTVKIIGDLEVTGDINGGNKGRLAARFATADGLPPKAFDIEHPTKGKGWRLRYVCLEGPEAGVYFRGRLKNEKVIKLPDSWKGLVHTDSISVQLQPIGSHQNIIVKRWDDDFIYLQGQGLPIDCFYHVYGERKDVNSVLVEYEGNSRYDYPDPNWNENSEMSPEERNLRDPNYKYPRNTITG